MKKRGGEGDRERQTEREGGGGRLRESIYNYTRFKNNAKLHKVKTETLQECDVTEK